MAEKKLDLSIIILNFNTKEFLRQCLQSINYQLSTINYEIIVVDNASTDGSVEIVKEFAKKHSYQFVSGTESLPKKKAGRVPPIRVNSHKPTIRLIENRINLGFAAGNNLGIPQSHGQYVLFLNPDTKVLTDSLKTMIEFMGVHPRVGAATCRVELPNGQLDDACHRGFPTPWNAFCHFVGLEKILPKIKFFSGYSLRHLPLDKTHEIDSGCGAFLMVRRKAGNQIGWWDEDYFWYGEDLDFCYRLKEKGWQIFFVPETRIIHYKGAASGIKKHTRRVSTATRETKLRSARSSTQVMRIFYQKHYQDKYPRLVNWLVARGIDLIEKIRVTRI